MRRLIVRVVGVVFAAALAGCAAEGDASMRDPIFSSGPSTTKAPETGAHNVTVYPRIGSQNDDGLVPLGPGIVLMGGGADVDDAFVWSHSVIGGSRRVAGDVVVLTINGDDSYAEYLSALATFNSVQTVRVAAGATDTELHAVAHILAHAEMAFLTGEEPSAYLGWRRTPIEQALQTIFDRGGVIGGTGGGAAIFGEIALDGRTDVASYDALHDPYEKSITFSRRFLSLPQLEGTVVEPHFRDLDHFGRLAAFMARQVADGAITSSPPVALGIGIDEGSAMLIDRFGRVTLKQAPHARGGAYLVTGGAADQIAPSTPLVYRNLLVTRLDESDESFDTLHDCGTAFRYAVAINGGADQQYSPRDPYAAQGISAHCTY